MYETSHCLRKYQCFFSSGPLHYCNGPYYHSYDSNLNDLFQVLGWQKLCHQRLDKKSIMMYETLHGMTPEYLRS